MKIAQTFVRQMVTGPRPVHRRLVTSTHRVSSRGLLSARLSNDLGIVSGSTTIPIHARAFSSEAKSVLLDILAKEEQEEINSGNTEMPAELKEMKATIEQEWRIVEDGATTSLFRKNHSHKVQVSFHCQDTVEDFMDEDFADEEEEEEPSPSVQFSVTITKAGKSLVFACFSEYGSCKIQGVSTTGTAVDTIHDNQGTLAKSEYQGPDFLELAEELQDQLLIYLEEECGVNADVAAFIAMFSDYREQACYVNWLKETQNIVS
jgi:complement component 1 Q subcomponent-binding protein, mitochondrial